MSATTEATADTPVTPPAEGESPVRHALRRLSFYLRRNWRYYLGWFVAVLFYVAIFVLPLACLVLLRIVLGQRMVPLLAAIKGFFDTWGKRIMVVLLILLGLFLVVDGALYFVTGSPAVPIGWPSNPG